MRQPGEVLSRSTSSREKSANWLAKGWAGVADVAEGRLFKEFVEPENLERLDFKWPTNEPWNWFLEKKNLLNEWIFEQEFVISREISRDLPTIDYTHCYFRIF